MSITVLLADDHAVVRDGLQSMLEAQGDIEVIGHAGTGYEAVSQITELFPDVAVVDIAMPEMNGIDAGRGARLRAEGIGWRRGDRRCSRCTCRPPLPEREDSG